MRPPAPAATLAFGSPNACNLCHVDKDAHWSDEWVRRWEPRDYQAPLLDNARLIAAARKQNWSELPAMLKFLASTNRHEVWTASLIQLLRPCEDERKWPALLGCLKDPSPLVRAAAVDACSDGLRPDAIRPLLAATSDELRVVRIRAAAALAPLPADMIPNESKRALGLATAELEASLVARPDDSASHYNLGNLHMERREYDKAIAAFDQASKLQPESLPALVNASLAHTALGQNDKAEQSLRRALKVDPTNAVANLNLGMLAAELGKLADAERAFRTAFASDPKSAAAAYNLGVLLANDRSDEAVTWSQRAAQLRPQEPKYAYTLAYFLASQNKSAEAIDVLEKSVAQTPPHADSFALLGQLYETQQNLRAAAALYQRAANIGQFPAEAREQFAKRARILQSPETGTSNPAQH